MKLIDNVKELFQSKNKEAELEAKYINLLDKTDKGLCKNQIAVSSGPGSSKSISQKLANWKKTLTEEQQDYWFSFVGMEDGGYRDFENYLIKHSHSDIWKKFLYEHNDIDEFVEDIKNIYRRKIYYHKYENGFKQGKISIANADLLWKIRFKIVRNNTGWLTDKKEKEIEEYTNRKSLSKEGIQELLPPA